MTDTAPQTFRLLLSDARAVDSYETADALHVAGFGDVTFGVHAGVPYADIEREAVAFEQVVLDTIAALESIVEGLFVVRVEPDELVTASRIAQRTGRTRQSVNLLIAGARGAGDFPAPVTFIDAQTRVWRWTDVSRWFAERQEEEPAGLSTPTHNEFLAALNGALTARQHLRRYRDGGGSNRHASRVAALVTRESDLGAKGSGKAAIYFWEGFGGEPRRRPAEADALLSLGCRVAERAKTTPAVERVLREHLVRALGAYDVAVILRTFRRDAAAHAHDLVAFSCAAQLDAQVTRTDAEVMKPDSPHSERFAVYLNRYLQQCDECRHSKDVPTRWFCAHNSRHLDSGSQLTDLQSWLVRGTLHSEATPLADCAFSAFTEYPRTTDIERWLHRSDEQSRFDQNQRKHQLYLSFALTQAISNFAPLLAPDERHLLSELSDHVEHALAYDG
jgi:hypothetical protein